MFVRRYLGHRKPLTRYHFRMISVVEAKKVMKIDSSINIDPKLLKQAYLKRAKEVHPDSGVNGCAEKFKVLQEAYQKLLDPNSRFEERSSQHQKQQNQYEEQFRNHYQNQKPYEDPFYDERRRQEYEKWRKETFSEYNKAQHDEFLKQRYDQMHRNQKKNDDSHFNSNTHFSGVDPNKANKVEEEDMPFDQPLFRTNNRILVFFFHKRRRQRLIWRYREEMFAFAI